MDPYRDFYDKIHQLLAVSDSVIVLTGLLDLVQGKQITIPDGTVIPPLQGLGEQPEPSDDSYQKTMMALLLWGIRSFPVEPCGSGPVRRLWSAMVDLDGCKGYGRNILRRDENPYRMQFEPDDFRIIGKSNTIPSTVPSSDSNKPVREFPSNDFSYIMNFMNNEPNVRTVTVTTSLFGWPRLSTLAVILYVDGEAGRKQGLAESATNTCNIPAIVIEATHQDLVSEIEEANELLQPPGLDIKALSARRCALIKNQPIRVPWSVSNFCHGQSVSLISQETKGSVGVFLSPVDNHDQEEVYAVTACHVLFPTSGSNEVITPGRLDILSCLRNAVDAKHPREGELTYLLARSKEPCGTVSLQRIGVNENGWRDDSAIIKLDADWLGRNGLFHTDSSMVELCLIKRDVSPSFTGSNGIVDCLDPSAGLLCYKDGAATGTTAGIIGETEAHQFRRGGDADDPTTIEHCRFLMLNQYGDAEDSVCMSGDSGAAVFCADESRDGWVWVGNLVSKVNAKDQSYGLIVPQSEFLASLEKASGKQWKLSGS